VIAKLQEITSTEPEAVVRDLKAIEFIPIKPLVARASTALERYVVHSRLP